VNVLYKRFDLGNVLGPSRADARSRFFDLTAGSLDLRITRESPCTAAVVVSPEFEADAASEMDASGAARSKSASSGSPVRSASSSFMSATASCNWPL